MTIKQFYISTQFRIALREALRLLLAICAGRTLSDLCFWSLFSLIAIFTNLYRSVLYNNVGHVSHFCRSKDTTWGILHNKVMKQIYQVQDFLCITLLTTRAPENLNCLGTKLFETEIV